MTETLRVTCLSCGQANRIPAARLSAGPKCGICGAKLIAAQPTAIDSATLTKAARDDLPLLVDFWAPWCGPCRQMAPQFQTAAGLLSPAVRLAKIDTQAYPEASGRYRIQGIPALGRGARSLAPPEPARLRSSSPSCAENWAS